MSAWLIYPPEGAGGGGDSGSQSVALSSGVSSVSVTFSNAFGSTNYVPLWSISNVTDATPIFVLGIITAMSSSGFTVTFNAPTDTANYVFNYLIAGYV